MKNQRPFTIARVIARLNVGGPAIQAILMTVSFLTKGYRALLITGEVAPGEASMEYLASEHHVTPIKLNRLSRNVSAASDINSLWQLLRLFWRERPVVVHTHTAKAGTLGRIAAILTRVPVLVHTFHGHVFNGYFSPSVTRVFLAIERLLARRTDCIIAVSESQRRDLVEVYRIARPQKVVTIPLGFDLERFLTVNGHNGSFRTSLGCPADAPLICWIGRLTAIKAPDLFLNAAALVLAVYGAARFVLVGDGELRPACETHILQAGLKNTITLTGWKRELASVYSDLDLLLLTSINEGTPLVLLEAMASGRAFIATDVGGVRDLMTGVGHKENNWERFDNGILVPRDAQTIAHATTFLLDHPELRRRMGNAGREFVRTRCPHERLASELEQLYLRLLREKGYWQGNWQCCPHHRLLQ